MPAIEDLSWDDDAEDHIARHGVIKPEVEDVCFGRHLQLRAGGNRYVLYGRTAAGRHLMVAVDLENGGMFYPVTAREMTSAERRRFRNWQAKRPWR
jgi:uncharacterized DUF497 family protein